MINKEVIVVNSNMYFRNSTLMILTNLPTFTGTEETQKTNSPLKEIHTPYFERQNKSIVPKSTNLNDTKTSKKSLEGDKNLWKTLKNPKNTSRATILNKSTEESMCHSHNRTPKNVLNWLVKALTSQSSSSQQPVQRIDNIHQLTMLKQNSKLHNTSASQFYKQYYKLR